MAFLSKFKEDLFIKNTTGTLKFTNGLQNSGAIVNSQNDMLFYGIFRNYGKTNSSDLNGPRGVLKLNSQGFKDVAFETNCAINQKFSLTEIGSCAFQSDGKILIGGDYTNYGGTTNRNRVIRVTSDGLLDTAFCVNASDGAKFGAFIRDIKVQTDGKILICGDFINYAGTTNRNRLIRLNSDGTLDTAFCVNAVDGAKFGAIVRTIQVQTDGKILVGGDFVNYGGTTNRSRLIRLNSDGTLDTAFCVNASDGTKIGAILRNIKVQADGKILVGGDFINYGGTTNRNRLIRLNSDGTLDTAFCVNASDGTTKFNGSVLFINTQSDGKILVGGIFQNYNGVTGRDRVLRLNSDGTLDTAFCVNASDGAKFGDGGGSTAWISSINELSEGKILITGVFVNYGSVNTRNHVVILNSDGTADNSLCRVVSDFEPYLNSLNLQGCSLDSQDRIIVAGGFTNHSGVVGRNALVRLLSDGSLDTAFCVNASDGNKFNMTTPIANLYSSITQSDGKILVGGLFTNYGATSNRNRLIRLNSDGSLDTAFCVNASDGAKFNSNVADIKLQSDGKILVGGSFTSYGGTANRNGLIRLNSDGTLDTAFCVNASDAAKFGASPAITFLMIQSDGKILVGGAFINYGGTTNRNRLIRLNSDGTLDTAFCVNASDGNKFGSTINTIKTQSDGKILVGGQFVTYAGTTNRNRLVRLNSDGTLDTAFCVNAVDGAKFNNSVSSIAVYPSQKIAVSFSGTYAGVSGRTVLVRLNSDGTLDTDFCINAVDGNRFIASGISPYLYLDSNNNLYGFGGDDYICGINNTKLASGVVKIDELGRSR